MFREAKYINKSGTAQIVTVDELDKEYKHSIAVKQKKFICPDCSEFVGFVYCKDKSSYFKHEKSDGTRKCEIYIKRISEGESYSPYERVGLPLYILKEGNNFSLNVGFYPIDAKSFQSASSSNLKFSMYTKENNKIFTKYINEESFSENETILYNVNRVSESYNLKFNFKNIPKSINEKWNNVIEGFGYKGAFFNFNKNGGMKIRKSEEITVKTDYYLITKLDISTLSNVNYKKLGEIKFESEGWSYLVFNIYKIKFTKLTKRNSEFCLNLGVLLVNNTPKLNPVWPPCRKEEQLYVYKNNGIANFYFNVPESSEKKVLLHPNWPVTINHIDKRKAVVSMYVSENEKQVSIERVNAPFSFAIVSRNDKYSEFNVDIKVKDIKGNSYTEGEYTKLPYKKQIIIGTNFKSRLYIYDNNILKNILKNDSYHIYDITYGQTLKVFHGTDCVYEIKFKRQFKENKNDMDLSNILAYQVGVSVPTPIRLKYILPKFKNYPKILNYIKNALKNGHIKKIVLLKILEQERFNNG